LSGAVPSCADASAKAQVTHYVLRTEAGPVVGPLTIGATGRLLFEVGTANSDLESFELLPEESVHIRPGVRHRMTAIVDTVVLEASTTELDDVVRLQDRYGR
jgi:hypothetical protein